MALLFKNGVAGHFGLNLLAKYVVRLTLLTIKV